MHDGTTHALPSLKQAFSASEDTRLRGDRHSGPSQTVVSANARMGTAWASPASLREAASTTGGAQTARALPLSSRADNPVGRASLAYGSPARQPPASSRGAMNVSVQPRAAGGQRHQQEGQAQVDAAAPPTAAALGKQAKLDTIRQELLSKGARHETEANRNAAFRAALADVTELFPQLGAVLMPVSNYLRDVVSMAELAERQHAEALDAREKAVCQEVGAFFEEKTLALLREKKKLEATAATLQQEVLQLRKDRDTDLTEAKQDVMRRLNEGEQKEDEFRSFRQLIAAVYKTNEQLTNRIEQLEGIMKQHRLKIPAAEPELYAFRSHTAAGNEVNTDPAVHRLKEQVSPEFIAASLEEMQSARLTLQRELLTNAFDDRTAYRLQVSSLKVDNSDLRAKVTALEEKVLELNRYIYEKRFLSTNDGLDGRVPMTPRPRDVPFGIQTDLGIDLKHSTAQIVAELSAVGTNLKHQLNSSLLRLRQMATVTDWMQENTLTELDVDDNCATVLPTFPMSSWPAVPHFLRTTVSPDVSNLRWSEAEAGAIFLQLFRALPELRATCRRAPRDAKMVEPRRYQLFERREHVMVRLDATHEELQKDASNVPFGYMVSQFIREYLMTLNPGSKTATVVLPGTLQPRYTVRGEQQPVELEFTRFAYNLWWAAQRYRDTEPLCRYFLAIVNGQLPDTLFEVMETLLEKVAGLVRALDVDGSRLLTFHRLAAGTAHVVADMGAQAGRCGLLAVAQSFEENGVSVLAGRIRMDALLADESCAALEPNLGEELIAAAAATRQQRGLPPRITVSRVPGRTLQPPGASVYVRYWRRLVMHRYERLYLYVERLLGPLVLESDVVVGLYLLPLPKTLALLQALEDEFELAPEPVFRNVAFPAFPDDDVLVEKDGVAEVLQEAVTGLPEVTKNYLSLLRERGQVVASRAAHRVTTLRELVTEALDAIPRLSRSVHFPFKNADDEARARFMTEQTVSTPTSSPVAAPKPPATATAPVSEATNTGTKKSKKKRKAEKAVGGTKDQSPGARGSKVSRTATAVAAHSAVNGSGRRSSTPAAVPEAMLIDDDFEMVEWYGFCAALRRCVPPLNDRLLKMTMPSPDWNVLLEGLRGQLGRDSQSAEPEDKPTEKAQSEADSA